MFVRLEKTEGGQGRPKRFSVTTKLYEIRWHGRGGQGAVTAAKIIAQAAYLKGYQGVTAASSFGAERRGVPVSASTRISPEPVTLVSQVEKPNAVVVLDQSLLKYHEVISGLSNGGWLIVNSCQHPNELNIKGDFNIATADATKVCRELELMVGGLPMVNTAMLGAFVRATQIVDMPSIEKVIKERFTNNAVNVNLAAIDKTYKITQLERIG
jgi:2-oxoacid:acceptor oxidoreductase gamma subunit (pyruvate/2-ketoisovalerate family)